MNAKKRALGKGLSALLQDGNGDLTERTPGSSFVAGSIADIRLSLIESNPFQPRDHFEVESLTELAASIRQQGIIQPVTVRRTGHDSYQLISGERRLKAARMAGLEVIPAFIREAEDEQMLELALVENIQRENLNATEIAISYQRLMEECSLTQDNLSARVGKSRATVANYVRLLRLPPEVQIAIRDEQISMGHARALIGLETTEAQLKTLALILEKGLSVREVEALVRRQGTPPPRHAVAAIPGEFRDAARSMSQSLGLKVSVKRNAGGKGSLTIRFSSDEEFRELRSRLKG
ncbi:MAG TPA: ParB/RepB/Spo0J family partition protein [Bacteroidales bacterium]|nr:ParB/RepB/Spo0J family partition protein [Bacteroidales bacterium]